MLSCVCVLEERKQPETDKSIHGPCRLRNTWKFPSRHVQRSPLLSHHPFKRLDVMTSKCVAPTSKYPGSGTGKCHICSLLVSGCSCGWHWGCLQSRVVAPKRLGNEVRLHEALGLVGAEVQLETLPEGVGGVGNSHRKAWHLGFPSHHGDQINDIVCGAAQGYDKMNSQ